jgi:hypothetical protein
MGIKRGAQTKEGRSLVDGLKDAVGSIDDRVLALINKVLGRKEEEKKSSGEADGKNDEVERKKKKLKEMARERW